MNKFKSAKEFLKYSYDVKDVKLGVEYWQKFLLSRCQNLFKYENLPDTLPAWEIEKNLIIKGSGAVIKHQNKLYIPFTGSPYGYDVYNVPNLFTFGNPVIGGQSGLKDGVNCAIIWNSEVDKLGGSWLWDTIKRYARLLADLESSLEAAMIYSRAGLVGSAENQATADTINDMLKKLEAGYTTTVVNKNVVFEDVKKLFESVQPILNYNGYIEARDYLINCFYNTIGLQTLEEKKERMITAELEVDNDVLLNNIDVMYEQRLENVAKINKTFGTDIKVYKNVMLEDEDEYEEEIEIEESEVNENESERILSE